VKGCKLSSPHPQRKVQLLNLQRGKKLSLVLARLVLDKKHKGHNVKPETRTQQVDEDYCPLEKDSSKKKCHAIEEKYAEAADK